MSIPSYCSLNHLKAMWWLQTLVMLRYNLHCQWRAQTTYNAPSTHSLTKHLLIQATPPMSLTGPAHCTLIRCAVCWPRPLTRQVCKHQHVSMTATGVSLALSRGMIAGLHMSVYPSRFCGLATVQWYGSGPAMRTLTSWPVLHRSGHTSHILVQHQHGSTIKQLRQRYVINR